MSEKYFDGYNYENKSEKRNELKYPMDPMEDIEEIVEIEKRLANKEIIGILKLCKEEGYQKIVDMLKKIQTRRDLKKQL